MMTNALYQFAITFAKTEPFPIRYSPSAVDLKLNSIKIGNKMSSTSTYSGTLAGPLKMGQMFFISGRATRSARR